MEPLELTTKEQAVLRELLDPTAKIEIILPKEIDTDILWQNLQLCARAVGYLERTSSRIKPVIGRLLLLVQERPEIYQRQGYRTFDEFLVEGIEAKLGASRAFLYGAKRLSEKWGSLPAKEIDAVGTSKLALLSRFTDQTQPNHPKFLKEAKKRTLVELRQWAEEQNLIGDGETEKAVIVIHTTKAVAKEWQSFSNENAMQEGAGTDDQGQILLRMMQECRSTWEPEVAEKAR